MTIYEADEETLNKYIRLAQFNEILENPCPNTVYEATYEAVFDLLLQKGLDIHYSVPAHDHLGNHAYAGCRALHFAAEAQNIHITRLLLEKGADFTATDDYGNTALHKVTDVRYKPFIEQWKSKADTSHALSKLLLSMHLSTNNPTNPVCDNGLSHLHLACVVDDVQAATLLLMHDVSNVNAVTLTGPAEMVGWSPLHFAAMACSWATAEVLLKNGANPYLCDANNITPLHWLIKRRQEISIHLEKISLYTDPYERNEKIIKMILGMDDRGECNPVDEVGLSHFHVACTLRDQTIFRKLLDEDVDIEASVSYGSTYWAGYTSLHFAAEFNVDTLKLLVLRGGNIVAKDVLGITPLDLCIKHWKIDDIHCIFTYIDDLKDLEFSNGTRLADFVLSLYNASTLNQYFETTSDVNGYLPLTSPLWPGYTAFHLAVFYEDRIAYKATTKSKNHYPQANAYVNSYVNTCLQHGLDYAFQGADGVTPLHLAFQLRNRGIVNQILRALTKIERPINVVGSDNISFFHIACATRCLDNVKQFLRSEVDVNEPIGNDFQWYSSNGDRTYVRSNSTALHISLIFYEPDIFNELLNNGANPMICDSNGFSSIHTAFAVSRHEVMNKLFASPLFDVRNLKAQGDMSHFHIACATGNIEYVARYLQLDDINVNARVVDCDCDEVESDDNEDDEDVFCPLLHSWTSYVNYTPMHFAVNRRDDNCDIVELLVQYGADPNITDYKNRSPIHHAFAKCYAGEEDVEHADILRIPNYMYSLYKYECENGMIDHSQISLLHFACRLGDVNEVNHLLSNGADPNARLSIESYDWRADTPLHVIVKSMFEIKGKSRFDKVKEIILLLMAYGANIDLFDSEGYTALHLLRVLEHHEVEDLFAAKCIANVIFTNRAISSNNPTDPQGFSHFHVACSTLRESFPIENFLNRGNVHMLNRPIDHFYSGLSPLHLAAHYGHTRVVETLLQYRANVLAEDSAGMTPLHTTTMTYGSSMSDTDIRVQHDNLEAIARFEGHTYVNAQNLLGSTPIEIALLNHNKRAVVLLVKNKANVNLIHPLTQKGILAMVREFDFFDDIIKVEIDLCSLDKDENSPLQNYFSGPEDNINCSDRYNYSVDKLIAMGSDLDHQNRWGKTALHIAAEYRNGPGLISLLSFGADVNIRDNRGHTVFDYSSHHQDFIFIYLRNYANMMRCVGLEVICSAAEFIDNDRDYETLMQWYRNLEPTVRNFLKEQSARDFPLMTRLDRDNIERKFILLENDSDMPHLGLLRMQRRRAETRMSIIDPAIDTMFKILHLDLPCCKEILRYLSNQDIRNFTKAFERRKRR